MTDEDVAPCESARPETVVGLREHLNLISLAEAEAGAEMFMDRPDRWLADPTWRCVNDHVSKRYLGTETRGDLCLACRESVYLTFPEDGDGPLVAPALTGSEGGP